MILVDTSVWIDWLADRRTRQVGVLSGTMASGEPVIVADLVLMELLQARATSGTPNGSCRA